MRGTPEKGYADSIRRRVIASAVCEVPPYGIPPCMSVGGGGTICRSVGNLRLPPACRFFRSMCRSASSGGTSILVLNEEVQNGKSRPIAESKSGTSPPSAQRTADRSADRNDTRPSRSAIGRPGTVLSPYKKYDLTGALIHRLSDLVCFRNLKVGEKTSRPTFCTASSNSQT
jgi:hypothetical protein